MKVREIMTSDAECVRPSDTLREAATLMRDLDVGALPVCGDDNRLAGMITDRDIAIRAVAEGGDPDSVTVGEVMTPEIVTCYEDDSLAQAADIMERKQIRRLVVLNSDKQLVGILSLGDVAVRGASDQLSAEALEEISKPVPV